MRPYKTQKGKSNENMEETHLIIQYDAASGSQTNNIKDSCGPKQKYAPTQGVKQKQN